MKKTIALVITAAALLLTSCASSENKNTQKGAGIGALAGAAVGAIIGHQTGNRAQGAAAGALLGAGIGGYAGHRMDQQAKELEKIAETKRTEQGLVTKLKSDILFETGKADLKPAAKANLKEMATIMKKYPENVLAVKGYTDATGSDNTNRTLSQKRADAVKKELTANGMPTTVVSTQGLGPANPVAENTSATGRKQNRRVEIEVTVDESKVPAEKK
ncbi:OmpA family protein [Bdellovibrio sp. qaytius]|nr:OmpA family protein [Bdellovibrio sp. qaytius]